MDMQALCSNTTEQLLPQITLAQLCAPPYIHDQLTTVVVKTLMHYTASIDCVIETCPSLGSRTEDFCDHISVAAAGLFLGKHLVNVCSQYDELHMQYHAHIL